MGPVHGLWLQALNPLAQPQISRSDADREVAMTDTAAASRAPRTDPPSGRRGDSSQRVAECDSSRAPRTDPPSGRRGDSSQRVAECDSSRAPRTDPPSGRRGDSSQRVAECDSSRAPRTSVHPSEVAELAAPIADEVGCALYDVQWRGGTLVVLASAAAGGTVGVDVLSQLSRRLSAELDAADMIEGRYVLEVSSPGLERKLLRPEHFAGAIGERVVIRTSESPRRRIVGKITHADAGAVSVHVEELSGGAEGSQQASPGSIGQAITVPYHDISKARTSFEWGAQPPPKSGPGSNARPKSGATARERQRR